MKQTAFFEREREREREADRQRQKERETKRDTERHRERMTKRGRDLKRCVCQKTFRLLRLSWDYFCFPKQI